MLQPEASKPFRAPRAVPTDVEDQDQSSKDIRRQGSGERERERGKTQGAATHRGARAARAPLSVLKKIDTESRRRHFVCRKCPCSLWLKPQPLPQLLGVRFVESRRQMRTCAALPGPGADAVDNIRLSSKPEGVRERHTASVGASRRNSH